MTDKSLEDRNAQIRKRMLDVSEMCLGPMPTDSPWVRPKRLNYIQDGRAKNWDLVQVHDSVGIVVFNISRKKLIFVRQFRPVSYFTSSPRVDGPVDMKKYPPTLGLTLELCAGIVDKDKSLVEIARDELREECGYDAPASAFTKLITYRFVALAATRQTLFYVEVTDAMNTHPGGGDDDEGELIEVVEMTVPEIKEYISQDEVQSPASFLNGVAWFLANKPEHCT